VVTPAAKRVVRSRWKWPGSCSSPSGPGRLKRV
jgi:hypothetical protein